MTYICLYDNMQHMNNTLARTTVTLPQTLLRTAKIVALHKNKPLSRLITEALEEKLLPQKKVSTQNPMELLGKYKLGINKIYEKRSELYEEHIKRKMGF